MEGGHFRFPARQMKLRAVDGPNVRQITSLPDGGKDFQHFLFSVVFPFAYQLCDKGDRPHLRLG